MNRSTSPLDDVIDYLIDTFSKATGLDVKDGPDDVETSTKDMLLVGVRLDDQADEFIGDITFEQSVPYIGVRWKEEKADVPCSILVWSGDRKARPRRSKALDYLAACEAAHRADLSLGDLVEDSEFANTGRVVYLPGEKGNLCVLTFTVTYRARLSPHQGA
jgi:hypothetical protein